VDYIAHLVLRKTSNALRRPRDQVFATVQI